VTEAFETVEKLGIKHADDIANNLHKLQAGTDESVKIAEKILGKDLSKATEEVINADLGQAYKKLSQAANIVNDLNPNKLKIAEKIAKVTDSKVGQFVGKGMGAAQIGVGGLGAYNIGEKLITGKGEEIKVSDLKDAVAGAALGRMWLRNNRVGRAINKFTSKEVVDPKTTFTITKDGKTESVFIKDFITPDEKSLFGKAKDNTIGKAKNIFRSSAKKEAISKEAEEKAATALKDKLAKAYNKENEGAEITAENISLDGFKSTAGSTGLNYGKLIDKSSLYKSRDLKDYALAEKALKTGRTKPYSGI